jgi:hypothetical protein
MMEIHGFADAAVITDHGARISGWFVAPGRPDASVQVYSGERVIASARRTVDRRDVAEKFGKANSLAGFNIDIGWKALAHHLEQPFTYRVLAGEQVAALPIHDKHYLLKLLPIKREEYWYTIQDPATRISDRRTIFFVSSWIAADETAEASMRASALCVLLYRLIEYPDLAPGALGSIWLDRLSDELLRSIGQPGGVSPRWYVSLLLAKCYQWIILDDDERALRYLEQLKAFDLQKINMEWGLNYMKGIALLGYLYFKKGKLAPAVETFLHSMRIMPAVLPSFEPVNFYKVEEVTIMAAIQLLCYEACMVIDPGRFPRYLVTRPLGLDLARFVPIAQVLDVLKVRYGDLRVAEETSRV